MDHFATCCGVRNSARGGWHGPKRRQARPFSDTYALPPCSAQSSRSSVRWCDRHRTLNFESERHIIRSYVSRHVCGSPVQRAVPGAELLADVFVTIQYSAQLLLTDCADDASRARRCNIIPCMHPRAKTLPATRCTRSPIDVRSALV